MQTKIRTHVIKWSFFQDLHRSTNKLLFTSQTLCVNMPLFDRICDFKLGRNSGCILEGNEKFHDAYNINKVTFFIYYGFADPLF